MSIFLVITNNTVRMYFLHFHASFIAIILFRNCSFEHVPRDECNCKMRMCAPVPNKLRISVRRHLHNICTRKGAVMAIRCLSARHAAAMKHIVTSNSGIRIAKSCARPLSFSRARSKTLPEFVYLLRISVIEMRFSSQLSD